MSIGGTMPDKLFSKISACYEVDADLPAVLTAACGAPQSIAAGSILAEMEAPFKATYLISEGWVQRSKTLADGRRQIVSFAVAGDFVGLNALLFRNSDYDVIAKTDLAVYPMKTEAIAEIVDRFPRFASLLFWISAREESILAERLLSLGRRSARERMTHLFSEIAARLCVSGQNDVSKILLPLTQDDIADTLGLSLVHTNKVLRWLEKQEIISFRHGTLSIINLNALYRTAGFDDGYLYFTQRNDSAYLPASERQASSFKLLDARGEELTG